MHGSLFSDLDETGPWAAPTARDPLPAPLPRKRALASTIWIALVIVAFIYGVAKRLLWHLLG